MDKKLGGGLFSGFKWGTEAEVGPEKKPAKKVAKKRVGDGFGSDRGLGGNNAYRNTESARLSDADESQRSTVAQASIPLASDGWCLAEPSLCVGVCDSPQGAAGGVPQQ